MSFKDRNREDGKILEVDAAMSGSLVFKDPVNLRINGRFEGNLETKGNLVIGPTANVHAHIIGDTIVIAGKVKGEILAKQKLTVVSTATVEGQVRTAKLVTEEGAIIEGTCHMLSDFMNTDELAKYLEVETSSVIEWASSGKVPGIKEQDNWKFARKAIDEWVASGKVK